MAFALDEANEPLITGGKLTSKQPCPVCGKHKWQAYYADYDGVLKPYPWGLIARIDRHYTIGRYDECVNCHTVVC